MDSDSRVGKKRRRVGVGLSLEKFVGAKKSAYDKRRALERQRVQHARKAKKFRLVKARLEREGRLNLENGVAELEERFRQEDDEDFRAGLELKQTKANGGVAPREADAGEADAGDSDDGDGDQSGRGVLLRRDKRASDINRTATKAEEEEVRRAGGGAEEASGRKRMGRVQTGGKLTQREASGRHAGSNNWKYPAVEEEEFSGSGVQDAAEASQGTVTGVDGPGARKTKTKWKWPPSRLERVAAKVRQKREEEQAARDEARRKAEERRQAVLEHQVSRKRQHKAMLKKTCRGQPVMKHRISSMLDKLQKQL